MFKFSIAGIIFISLILGLRNLDESYFDIILLLFNNFIIISNLYLVKVLHLFIWFNRDHKLLYASPHLNQKAENHDISSYEIKDLYLLDIKELSGGITIGININNSTDFKILIYELQWLHKKYTNIMNFK